MSETLSEAAGCELLARLFRARGYAVRRNVPFREYGVSFDIDGWDPAARVGFEFLSSERADHQDLSLAEFERLKDAEQRGELSLFIIDEVEPLSAEALSAAAGDFLDDLERRGADGISSRGGRSRRPSGSRIGTTTGSTPDAPSRKPARKKTIPKAGTGRAKRPAPAQPAPRAAGTRKPVSKKPPAVRPAAKVAAKKARRPAG